jgi:hypothetical protein
MIYSGNTLGARLRIDCGCLLEPVRVVVTHFSAKEASEMRTQGMRSDPAVMMGNKELGAGQTIDQLLQAHPRLTRDGALAAVRFGAEVLRADVAYPLSKSVA